jgi:hypothetical protein
MMPLFIHFFPKVLIICISSIKYTRFIYFLTYFKSIQVILIIQHQYDVVKKSIWEGIKWQEGIE